MSNLQTPAIVTDDKMEVKIIPFGSDEEIKLNVSIVQNLIAVPTREGHKPDRNSCIKFMMLCRARHLNPFEGDAFLLGYDTQKGPQFSLITAHQVFLKRAEASPQFDGMTSGVIVEDDGKIVEREGDFLRKDEILLGGWASVHRKDRKIPCSRKLNLGVFSTGRSRWEKDPAGMIVKCAEADALRSSFPSHLGGLYTQDEGRAEIDITPAATVSRPTIDTAKSTETDRRLEDNGLKDPVKTSSEPQPAPDAAKRRGRPPKAAEVPPSAPAESVAPAEPVATPPTTGVAPSLMEQLSIALQEAGHTQEQCIAELTRQKLAMTGWTLADLPEATLGLALEHFAVLSAKISEAAK